MLTATNVKSDQHAISYPNSKITINPLQKSSVMKTKRDALNYPLLFGKDQMITSRNTNSKSKLQPINVSSMIMGSLHVKFSCLGKFRPRFLHLTRSTTLNVNLTISIYKNQFC